MTASAVAFLFMRAARAAAAASAAALSPPFGLTVRAASAVGKINIPDLRDLEYLIRTLTYKASVGFEPQYEELSPYCTEIVKIGTGFCL